MKIKYITCDLTKIEGIERAEKLKAEGWEIGSHSPFSIQFYKRIS